jgi:hypothetical protein
MTVSFRCLASGDSFASLAHEFRIGESTLNDFDKKNWSWFREQYWETCVTGQSRVDFDDLTVIEVEEFITCMDGLHLNE